jgi:hypothetical protein
VELIAKPWRAALWGWAAALVPDRSRQSTDLLKPNGCVYGLTAYDMMPKSIPKPTSRLLLSGEFNDSILGFLSAHSS